MSIATRLTRLRAAARNALVWAVAWSALGFMVTVSLSTVGVLPDSVSWLDGLFMGARIGVVGAAAGAAFSVLTGILYRGKRISELSWVRFGIGGGIITAVCVPAFLQTMNVLSGDGMVPIALVLDDSLWLGTFAAIAAGASLCLAQHADNRLPAGSEYGEIEPVDPSYHARTVEAWDAAFAQRSRSVAR